MSSASLSIYSKFLLCRLPDPSLSTLDILCASSQRIHVQVHFHDPIPSTRRTSQCRNLGTGTIFQCQIGDHALLTYTIDLFRLASLSYHDYHTEILQLCNGV